MKTTLKEYRALHKALRVAAAHPSDRLTEGEKALLENYEDRLRAETMSEKDRRLADHNL